MVHYGPVDPEGPATNVTIHALSAEEGDSIRGRGWQVLLDRFRVPGLPRPYRVMGLKLEGL